MKRIFVAAVSTLALAGLFVFSGNPGANAQGDTTEVYVANAFTYAAGNPFEKTFCVDGSILATNDTTDTSGPFTVDAGDHTVTMNSSADCLSPEATTNATFPAGGSVTIMGFWPREEHAVVVLPNDTSCLESGQGRLTVRHAATIYGESTENVDVQATPPGGDPTTIIQGLAPGAQSVLDLDTGTYSDVTAFEAGTTTGGIALPDLDVAAGQNLIVYVYGGQDGAIGAFTYTMAVSTCAVATTTTTTAPTTTTTVAPVQAQPAFTG